MGISKTSLLFCFGLLVGFHECTQDFFFDDQGFITDKSGSKEVTKQLKEREIVLISDDTDLLNDGSGEGSGGTGEGSSGSGEGSGEAEILYSTSSNDAVQSTASEHVVTTTDDLLTITNQEDEVTISHGAITDESGDGSGDIDDVEQSGSGEGNEETGLPDFELVTDAVHSAATESLKAV